MLRVNIMRLSSYTYLRRFEICRTSRCSYATFMPTAYKRGYSTNDSDRVHDKSSPPKRSRFLVTAIASLTMAGIVGGYLIFLERRKQFEKDLKRKANLSKTMIGGTWEMLNYDGKLISSDAYRGKWQLIYFGFTHCPDICPEVLERMVLVGNAIDEDKTIPDISMLFFTVDPARDTPAALKKYCTEFSPKLMGFTGSKEQVDAVSKTFRVYHGAGPKDNKDDYIVDHTIIIYLIDPDGDFVDYFGQKTTVDEITDAVKRHMRKHEHLQTSWLRKFTS